MPSKAGIKEFKKPVSKEFIFFLLVAGIISIFLLINNFSPWTLDEGSQRIKTLQSIEVTEYNGQDLSSIADFRENSIRGPQYIDRDEYRLAIRGLVDYPQDLTYDEVIKHDKYEKVVNLQCVEGWDVDILWEGILVRDILDMAKASPEAKSVVFHAEDGYSSGFPLEYFYDNDIIMAYKMNGVEIPPERGFPFQLVAESKWGYKWVKWITEIELTDKTDYKGYWESRGYDTEGDLKDSFLE